jgi:hydrogenase maturation protease
VSAPRILVAGIGNLFLADDGFGCEVARRLAARPLPDGVRVKDYGIRGLDLAYELLEPYDAVILVDAVRRGDAPGTVTVLQPEEPADDGALPDPHGISPSAVLRLAKSLGGRVPGLRLVGCEPAVLGSEEELVRGLSPAVEAAVEPAIEAVISLLSGLRSGVRRDA